MLLTYRINLQLVHSDVEVLSAGITALGGQWRMGLTSDVTHLFAVYPGSDKYKTAFHHQHTTRTKVLVPHWFDDTIRLGYRGLDTKAYEWPDPMVLKSSKAREGLAGGSGSGARASYKLSGEKADLFGNLLSTEDQTMRKMTGPDKDIWGGRRILLSSDLDLQDGRRQTVEMGIQRCGGKVVEYEGEFDDVDPGSFDVLIARHRWGYVYLEVFYLAFFL